MTRVLCTQKSKSGTVTILDIEILIFPMIVFCIIGIKFLHKRKNVSFLNICHVNLCPWAETINSVKRMNTRARLFKTNAIVS